MYELTLTILIIEKLKRIQIENHFCVRKSRCLRCVFNHVVFDLGSSVYYQFFCKWLHCTTTLKSLEYRASMRETANRLSSFFAQASMWSFSYKCIFLLWIYIIFCRYHADYYEKIVDPVDLNKIAQRIKLDEYRDIELLTTDIQLMTSNAKKYYDVSTDYVLVVYEISLNLHNIGIMA